MAAPLSGRGFQSFFGFYASLRAAQRSTLSKNQTYNRHLLRQFTDGFKASTPSKTRRTLRNIGLLSALGLGVGGYCGFHHLQSGTLHADQGQGNRPYFKPSRTVRVDTDNSNLKVTIYQYQNCPFCCKVRAFLDYTGLSYDIIEVNSVFRQQVKWSKYKKVPIVVIEGEGEQGFVQLNDSSLIISALQSFLLDRSVKLEKILECYPVLEEKNTKGKVVYDFPNRYFIMFGENKPTGTADQRKEERKWRHWVDGVLVHALSPNVYRTPAEARQAFHYFSEAGEWEKNFAAWERYVVIYVGAFAMYFLGKILKKRHNLKDDVRQSLYDACNEWARAVGKNRPFMGGDQPNLADLAMYGALSSIEGCDAFQDLQVNSRIRPWYNRTKKAVTEHAGAHPLTK